MSLDSFKEFVKKHPKLKDEVSSNKRTWQKIYEDFTILGEDDDSWIKYRDENFKIGDSIKEVVKEEKKFDGKTIEDVKNVINYLKKVDTAKVASTLTSAQKIMSLVQGFLGGTVASAAVNKATGDPLFDKKFDDWY